MYEIEDRIGVESGQTRLEFDIDTGLFSIYWGKATVLAGARVVVTTRHKKTVERFEPEGPWGVVTHVEGEEPGTREDRLYLRKPTEWGRLLFVAEPADGDALVIRLGFVWTSEDEPPRIEALIPLSVPPGGVWPGRESSRRWRAYVHGWQCWTPTAALAGKRSGDYLLPQFLPKRLKPMLLNQSTPVSSDRGRFESEWFSALADTDAGDSFVLGFTGVSHALSRVSMLVGRKPEQSELEALVLLEGKQPEREKTTWSEPLAVIPGDLSTGNLELYAEMLAKGQGVTEVRRAPTGWCSWYQYFRDVTEDNILGDLESVSGVYSDLGIELVQIDDGYTPNVGDWLETGPAFGRGMAAMAEEISSKGKIPGVWVAPFTVTRGSAVFREKKDWVQRNRKGRLVMAGVSPDWGGRYYGLDVTNPEVLDWLREVFTTLAGYGFRFFKLDFLACGLLEGKRHDETLTRAEAARHALEIIRESVGDEAIIMAAGGPVLLGAGILDAQRISGDVAPFWTARYQRLLRDRATPGTRNSLFNTMTRAFLSGRVFDGDPDCLLARSKDSKLTQAERRTLASAIAVLGGSFMVSDDTSLWEVEEIELLARSLPHSPARPLCPDLWKSEVPRFLVSKMEDPFGEYRLALAVNWTGGAREMSFKLEDLGLAEGRWHASEFWSGEYLGEITDAISIGEVEPHGCGLLRLTRAQDSPQIVGSNINLSQGASEVVSMGRTAGGVSLVVRSPIKCEAVITMVLPGAGDLAASLAGGGEVAVERLTTLVYRLKFDLDGEARLDLNYGKAGQ